MMAKKDYIKAASIVTDHVPSGSKIVVIGAFETLFMNDDPQFDSVRFRIACGMPADVVGKPKKARK